MRLRAWGLVGTVALLGACDSGPTEPVVTLTLADPAAGELVAGDTTVLRVEVSDPDAPLAWESSNPLVARVTNGMVEGLRPGRARITATAGGGASSVLVDVVPREGGYTADEVDYFLDIALGFEFGVASRIVRKWRGNVRLQVNGSPNAADSATLADVIADINALTSEVDIVQVDSDAAVEVHFAHTDTFAQIHSNYRAGNIGYFAVWFDGAQYLDSAVVLIATNTEQAIRDHLIREEVTQMLGMGRDSFRYPTSIFQQAFTRVSEYAPIDEAVIEILYRPELMVGMNEITAGRAARRLLRGVVDPTAASAAPLRASAHPGRPGSAAGSAGRR